MAVTHRNIARLAANLVRVEQKLELLLQLAQSQDPFAKARPANTCSLCKQAMVLRVVDDLPSLKCECQFPFALDTDFVDSLKQPPLQTKKERDNAADKRAEAADLDERGGGGSPSNLRGPAND